MLCRPRLAPLRQRVSVHCRLEPLTAAEIPPFIRARLAAAGYEGRNAVRPDALRLIARYSAGVPGTIITICDKVLQAAHLSGRQDLSAELVRQVARGLRLEEPGGGARPGPGSGESTAAPADARQEEDAHAAAGEPGHPRFRLFARRLRTPSVVRLGGMAIALLALWLVAHTSRVAETVPPQPQVRSPSRAASGARPDAPNPARGGYVHIPVTQAVPAPPSPVSFPAHVQTAERGHALFQTLARRYPKIRPFLWGAMTERPMIALFLPEAEWAALSEEERGSLVLYLASLIPAAKAEPAPYTDAFRAEPSSPALRARVAHLCADCWVIGVGRPTLDGQGVLLDRVVAQGDAGRQRSGPPDRGLKASPHHSGQKTIASAVQGRSPAETPAQPGGHTPPHVPSEVEGEEQLVQSDAPAGVREVGEPHQRVVFLEDEEQEGEIAHDAAVGGSALASRDPAATAFAQDEEQEQRGASAFPPGSPPRLYSDSGRALLKGAENGDLSTVKRLLAAGVSPNEPSPGGWTPLIMAALSGHTAVVRLLLEHGADVHATNNRGMTALMYAAWNRHAEVIRLLLKHGARVDVADHDGWTAVQYARDTRLRPKAKKDAAVITALFEQAIARQ